MHITATINNLPHASGIRWYLLLPIYFDISSGARPRRFQQVPMIQGPENRELTHFTRSYFKEIDGNAQEYE